MKSLVELPDFCTGVGKAYSGLPRPLMKLMFNYSNEDCGIGIRVALRSKARASYEKVPKPLFFEGLVKGMATNTY